MILCVYDKTFVKLWYNMVFQFQNHFKVDNNTGRNTLSNMDLNNKHGY